MAVAVAVADVVGDTVPVRAVRERLACSWQVAPCEHEGNIVGSSVVRGPALTRALARRLGVPAVPEAELRTPFCPWIEGAAPKGVLLELRPPAFRTDGGTVSFAEVCRSPGAGVHDGFIRWFTYRVERVDGK